MLLTLLATAAFKLSTLPNQKPLAKPTIVCGKHLLLAHHGEKEAHESAKEGGKGHVRGWHEAQKAEEMMAKRGLYSNIHAKRKRIAAGSGEKMRKPGSKGAPTAAAFKKAAKTTKKRRK